MDDRNDRTEVLEQVETDGYFLRRHRQLAGLTMTAVAAQAGFSVAYLSQIESGKKSPSVATIAKIAEAIAEAKRGAA